mgnify:CR=1 FL=1
MNRFLLFLGVFLVAVLAGLFAVPAAIDWNSYRGAIERQTSAILGRDVRVGGNVRLQLLPAPFLHLENIRIADASGRFDRPLLRLGGFTIWLSVAPLLRGDFEVREVQLSQPELRLAVDAEGKGNWQGLGQGEGSLPFVPNSVTLGAIGVEKGMLILVSAEDRELARVTAITGELSASALVGPFRFKGDALLAGELRQVRVATGPLNASEGIRLKAVVSQGLDDTAIYTLDGLLTGMAGVPQFTGTAEAALAIRPTTSAAVSGEDAAAGGGPSVLEVKSAVTATATGAAFTDIIASFESKGRPQQIAGKAEVTWNGATHLSAELATQWLDLDEILGDGAGKGIWQSLHALSGHVAQMIPPEATANIAGRLVQAKLGAATVSDLAMEIAITPESFTLARLTARLPGQSDVELSGELGRDGGAGFSGPVRLRGMSLPRLAGWIVPGLQLSASTGERPFVIEGEVKLSDDGLLAEQLRAEIAGTALTSRLQYNTTEPRSLEISLDSDRLDLRDVLDLPVTLSAMRSWLAPAGDGTSAAAGEGPAKLLAGTDTRIDAHIGQLLLNGGEMQDVVADIHRQAGRLDVTRLELATASGLTLDLAGQLSELVSSPKGQLRMMIDAESAQSIEGLASFLELPAALTDPRLAKAMAPMRLAGSLVLGRHGAETSDFAVDGTAGASRVIVTARADGATLEHSQVDFSASLENADETVLLTQLFSGWGDVSAMPSSAGPGRLSISASGMPSRGLTSVGVLDAVALRGRFDGKLTLAKGEIGADGKLSIAAAQSGLATRLIGAHQLLPGDATALTAEANLKKSGDQWRFEEALLEFGGQEIRGRGAVTLVKGKTAFELDMSMPEASLARFAGVLAGTVPAGTLGAADGNLWSDAAIDFSALTGIAGKIRLSVRHLDALYGLNLDNAELRAELTDSTVRIDSLSGDALGGRVMATGALEKAPAGAAATATAKLIGGRLETLATGDNGEPRARGTIDATLTVHGRGLSPRGILALLEGSGNVQSSEGDIAALSPQAIDEAARVVLSEPSELDKDRLALLLARDPLSGNYPFKAFATELIIGDGVIKSEPVTFDAEQARLTITTAVDLHSLRLDSEWVLKPNPPAPDKTPLPPVTFVYAGAIHDLGTLTPRIEADALVRELTARKFIGGAEQLDGLWPSPAGKILQEGKAGGVQPADGSDTATLTKSMADWDAVIQSQPAP